MRQSVEHGCRLGFHSNPSFSFHWQSVQQLFVLWTHGNNPYIEERERDKQIDREKQRERERETERERDRDKQRDRRRETNRKIQRQTERDKDTHREQERDWNGNMKAKYKTIFFFLRERKRECEVIATGKKAQT